VRCVKHQTLILRNEWVHHYSQFNIFRSSSAMSFVNIQFMIVCGIISTQLSSLVSSSTSQPRSCFSLLTWEMNYLEENIFSSRKFLWQVKLLSPIVLNEAYPCVKPRMMHAWKKTWYASLVLAVAAQFVILIYFISFVLHVICIVCTLCL
jgi:hypothetical protein